MAGYEKLPVHKLLPTVFPNLHSIYMTRRDKVRQDISYWKAIQTGEWISFTESQTPMKELHFDFHAIERLRQDLIKDEEELQQYFRDYAITPYTVVYEDFIQAYEETVLQILEYLQIIVPKELVFAPRSMKKQSDAQSQEWVERYYQSKQQ